MEWQPSARPVAGVAFDCDGLLVETESCWTTAISALFARHGQVFTPELKARLIGTTIDFNVTLMADWFARPGEQAQLRAELTDSVAEVIAAHAEPMPGAVSLVRALAGRLPIAVVSNSERRLVDISLGRAGLTDAFEVIVAGQDVVNGKPAPDLYLRACDLLAVKPASTVAFEDSLVGVNSAKAAGLTVVGVPTVYQEGFSPDHQFASLTAPELIRWALSFADS